MDLKEQIIHEIKTLASQYPIEKVVLFGSRARGDNQSRSDIDLAVFPASNFLQEGEFFCKMDELDTLLKIDLVFVTPELDPRLLQIIHQEGVVLYDTKAH